MGKNSLENFTETQKETIFKRDNYRCVFCGFGTAEGLKIYAEPIEPKYGQGKSKTTNGQTLCGQHKKETGKHWFIRLYELAKAKNDKQLQSFCAQILEVYEKNGINSHIEWQK